MAERAPQQPHVQSVEAAVVRPLRHAILRPHQPIEQLTYERDADPRTLHAAVLDAGGRALAVCSIAPGAHPRDPRPGDWRIRGMATDPGHRGRGLGAAVLAACLEHARANGARRVWCNARTPARSLYERAGFAAEGEEFELEQIGPHYVMSVSAG